MQTRDARIRLLPGCSPSWTQLIKIHYNLVSLILVEKRSHVCIFQD